MGGNHFFAEVRWVLRVQILTIGFVTVVTWAIWGWPLAKWALLGGIAAFLPNAFFAAKVGRADTAQTSRQVLRSFYFGETIKLILTAILFLLIFQLPNLRFEPLFAGFASVLMVFWFALLARIKSEE